MLKSMKRARWLRDFKPENVMVGNDGRVRVLDFGLVRAADQDSAGEPALSASNAPVAPSAPSDSLVTIAGGPQGRTKANPRPPTVEDVSRAPSFEGPEPHRPSVRSSGMLSEQLTRAGTVMGTPRYMAPEQHLAAPTDERADQFSFCISLCEALWGVDPFGAETPEERLIGVLDGRVTLPAEARVSSRVRAILVRGLQPIPQARWLSMPALLAELRRDPAAVWRRAALVILSTLAIASALTGGGAAIQARRMAAKQAQIAREFGLEQAQIATTARIGALLPLHDLRPEIDEIRAHLAAIATQMMELGAVALGPGHAALGSGYLALERWDDAVRELEAAFQSGYHSPELAYALGIAHGKLYQKALVELVKTDDPAADAQRREAIMRAHREPALRHLTEASRSPSLQHAAPPQYVEGLIALYEDRFEEALRHARQAVVDAPTLFEARTLEGDIQMAIAKNFYLKGDDEADALALGRAGDAYRSALGMARSSFSALGGECRRLVAIAHLKSAVSHDPEPEVKTALAACATAAQVRPDEARPLASQADVWNTLALYQSRHDIDPTRALDEAKALAEAALRLDPRNVSALRELGERYLTMGGYRLLRGGDARVALGQAIAYARRGLAIDPNHFSLYTQLAYAYADKAKDEVKRGLDPRDSLTAEAECAKQQRRYLPHSFSATNTLESAYLALAHWQQDHGVDPVLALSQGITAGEEETRIAPGSPRLSWRVDLRHVPRAGRLRSDGAPAARHRGVRAGAGDRGVQQLDRVAQARAALEKALAISSFLARELRPLLDEAGRLAAPGTR